MPVYPGARCLQFRNCSDQPVNIRAPKVAENRHFHKRGEISGRATGVGFEKSVIFVNAVSSSLFYAWAVNFSDKNSLPWPAGTAPKNKTPQRPAKVGDVLIIYATGLGEVNPSVPDGHNALDGKLHVPLTAPEVLIGGIKAKVLGSALSPQFVGVYQINAKIPTGVPTGNKVSIQLKSGSVTSPAANASIAIE